MTPLNSTVGLSSTTATLLNITSTKQLHLLDVNWYYSSRFWLAFGVAGFLFNILELVVIIRQKKYKAVFGLSLTSLCIADIIGSLTLSLAGGLRLISYPGRETFPIYQNTVLATGWKVGHGSLQFSVGTSFIHIVYIAIQRLFAVILPLKFKAHFTYARCAAGIIIIWLIMFIYGTCAFFFSKVLLHVSYYFVLVMELILIITYGAITFKTWKDDKKRASLRSRVNSQGTADGAVNKVLFHSLAVTFAFLICTLPHSVFYIYLVVQRLTTYHDLDTYHTVNSVISINPVLDPLIYFFFQYHLSNYCFRKRSRKPIRGKVSPNVQIRLQRIVPDKM